MRLRVTEAILKPSWPPAGLLVLAEPCEVGSRRPVRHSAEREGGSQSLECYRVAAKLPLPRREVAGGAKKVLGWTPVSGLEPWNT
jgi:hypothetical protein